MILFIAIGSFPFIFLVHLLYERLWAKRYPPSSRQKAVARICLWSSLFCTLVAVLSNGFLDGLYVLITSLGFAHVYFHIFNMSETARRIRILTSAYAAQKEGVPRQCHVEYTPESMIEERIERLQAMRAVELKEGKFVSRFHPLLIATLIIDRYQRFFPL